MLQRGKMQKYAILIQHRVENKQQTSQYSKKDQKNQKLKINKK